METAQPEQTAPAASPSPVAGGSYPPVGGSFPPAAPTATTPGALATDSKAPAEWRVSHLLRPRGNVLAVEVVRWSAAAYLEGQDMWRLSGLARSAYLYARPARHIRDAQISATPLCRPPMW